jgi:hypothetical protein
LIRHDGVRKGSQGNCFSLVWDELCRINNIEKQALIDAAQRTKLREAARTFKMDVQGPISGANKIFTNEWAGRTL